MQTAGDWEEHLQLSLFAYCTTKHSFTGLSPHEVLFGYKPPFPLLPNQNVPCVAEPAEYSEKLQRKPLELRELVEANIVESTTRQQRGYHCQGTTRLLLGQKVLMSNPTRDLHWTGPWVVIRQLDNTSVKVRMGTREQVIHINPFFRRT